MNPALIVHQLKVLAAQAEATMNTCILHEKLVPYFNGKLNTFEMLQGKSWDDVCHAETVAREFVKENRDKPENAWLRECAEGSAAAATEILALLVASAPDEKPSGPPGVVIRATDFRRMKFE